jgi:hypothetical protein
VTNENIHLAIGAGDEIVSGVIDMHSVCYSNMGIGVQAYLNRAVIKKRAGYDPAAFDEAFGETIEVDEDLQKLMASNAARVSAIAIDEDETKEEAVDAEVFDEDDSVEEPGEPNIDDEFA